MRERIGVWNGETGSIECDKCYHSWAKDYLKEHQDEMPKEDYKELQRTLENDSMRKHLELMGKYAYITPFYKNNADSQGEWCAWCGKELYTPICAKCYNEIQARPIETPSHEMLCQQCAELQRNRDQFKALQQRLHELEERQKELFQKWMRGDTKEAAKELGAARKETNALIRKLDLLRQLEQIQVELGIIDLNEVTTD